MKKEYEEFCFDNGIRLVYKRVPSTHIVHCGFTIHVGSRDDMDVPGIAHCFEHMVFKGTIKRKPIHILNRLEVVGGELNAFTTKEITSLYASIVDEHFERAVELLHDITFYSVFPDKELKKEKQVITEEINMYLDTPEENIFDEFQELVFEGHPLATNILGDINSLHSITPEKLIQFRNAHYYGRNIVFSVVGNLPYQKVLSVCKKYFDDIPVGSLIHPRKKFTHYHPQHKIKETDNIQAYGIIGNVAYPYQDNRRIPFTLLSNLLGGPGLNSRLNLAVREKYGFTYHVESGYTPYEAAGLFHAYVSTDKKNLARSLSLVRKELDKLRTIKLGSLQLHNAKQQMKGQILMAEESKINHMLLLGKQVVQLNRAEPLNTLLLAIDKVTSETLCEMANEVFAPESLSSLQYVPSE